MVQNVTAKVNVTSSFREEGLSECVIDLQCHIRGPVLALRVYGSWVLVSDMTYRRGPPTFWKNVI